MILSLVCWPPEWLHFKANLAKSRWGKPGVGRKQLPKNPPFQNWLIRNKSCSILILNQSSDQIKIGSESKNMQIVVAGNHSLFEQSNMAVSGYFFFFYKKLQEASCCRKTSFQSWDGLRLRAQKTFIGRKSLKTVRLNLNQFIQYHPWHHLISWGGACFGKSGFGCQRGSVLARYSFASKKKLNPIKADTRLWGEWSIWGKNSHNLYPPIVALHFFTSCPISWEPTAYSVLKTGDIATNTCEQNRKKTLKKLLSQWWVILSYFWEDTVKLGYITFDMS